MQFWYMNGHFTKLLLLLLIAASSVGRAQETSCNQSTFPFSTTATHLSQWNGERYVPFTVKGTNLGISVPGTFPGQLQATAADYAQWFTQIKAAGFNCIRLYTLHFPVFYEILDSFNRSQPHNPLYFFQGVWLEEEIPNYQQDLYELTTFFDQEIEENVSAVHGNAVIASRVGKAHGTFTTDVSAWNIGYIIGREIYPEEVLNANINHPADRDYEGVYLQLLDADPAETWLTKRLDHLLQFEWNQFGTQRPVSASSWPTLDPIGHPAEPNRYEDTAQIDISRVDFSRAPAGLFASYHAYPYYPDFMSSDPAYQGVSDAYGLNSYLAYLRDLKQHYTTMPLLIAEYGVPSSWGIAHFAQSGMHHGGLNELEQGKLNMRLLENILSTDCAGGLHFAWMDEWFKRTWINDPTDYIADSRVIWHNITSAEQNFGLLRYERPMGVPEPLPGFGTGNAVEAVEMLADYTYLNISLSLNQSFRNTDTLWFALDTYLDSLGERLLPTGDTLAHGAEFLIRLTNGQADLFITEAYDTYGIWHNVQSPRQVFRSTSTTGRPWKIVRWRNNTGEAEIQYIGHLNVKQPLAPLQSHDAVVFNGRDIQIRLPWTLLQFISPDAHKVLHHVPGRTDTISDGIRISSLYRNQLQSSSDRYLWPKWTNVLDVLSTPKQSYLVMQERLPQLPGQVMPRCDSYQMKMNELLSTSSYTGLLRNDLLTEPGPAVVQIDSLPRFGQLQLHGDGSFTYQPDVDFSGTDWFSYRVVQSATRSATALVQIQVEESGSRRGFVQLYPNPATTVVKVNAAVPIEELRLYNALGHELARWERPGDQFELPVGQYAPGYYWLRMRSGDQIISRKFMRFQP